MIVTAVGARRIVVVGGGLAAARSCEQLRRAGFDGKLTVLAEEPHPRADVGRFPLAAWLTTDGRLTAALTVDRPRDNALARRAIADGREAGPGPARRPVDPTDRYLTRAWPPDEPDQPPGPPDVPAGRHAASPTGGSTPRCRFPSRRRASSGAHVSHIPLDRRCAAG